MKRSLAIAAVLVVALAGCAPSQPIAEPDPTPSVTEPTPTPTPSQEPETGLTQPAQAFAGDCGAVISASDLSGLLGVDVSKSGSGVTVSLIEQSGGLSCSWAAPEFSYGVSVTAVPAAAVQLTEAPWKCDVGYVEFAPDLSCGIEVSANETTVAGLVWFGEGSNAAAKKKAAGVVAAIAEKIASNAEIALAVPAPIPAADAWSNPARCAEIDAAISSPDFMNGTPNPQVFRTGGNDAYFTPVARALYDFGGPDSAICGWYSELTNAQIAKGMLSALDVDVVGGGAWGLDEFAGRDGAIEVTIPGVERAILIKNAIRASLYVIDGPNLAHFTAAAGEIEKIYPSVPIVIEALNSL